MKFFAVSNSDNLILENSSSGGAFSILAQKVIEQGGIVYGATFDQEWKVVHQRVDCQEKLGILRGSKYVYSHVGDAYSEVVSDLEAGRKVLFSGTPCQVAAMRKRAGDNPNLLLVEVVCHGAPEQKYWIQYLRELTTKHNIKFYDIESINFRDKRNGWKNYNFTIKLRDGREISEFHGENIYMRGFLKNFTLREACFKCPFKYPDGSKADLTLGDFWKVETIIDVPVNELSKGISLVISRTSKGNQMAEWLVGRNECDDRVFSLNSALTNCARKPTSYSDFQRKASTTNDIIKLIETFTKEPLTIRIKVVIARILNLIGFRKI